LEWLYLNQEVDIQAGMALRKYTKADEAWVAKVVEQTKLSITVAKALNSLEYPGWSVVVRQSRKGKKTKARKVRSPQHDMAWLPRNKLWQCTECGIRSAKAPCRGEPSKKCFRHQGVASRADPSHRLWISRLVDTSIPMAFCGLCGSYATGRMDGLKLICRGLQQLSHSRSSIHNGLHPVTKEALGKPIRFRNRACWKDRSRRWEADTPEGVVSTGLCHGLPVASSSPFFEEGRDPSWELGLGSLDEGIAFLDDVWGPDPCF
jgi:hypothetical protein